MHDITGELATYVAAGTGDIIYLRDLLIKIDGVDNYLALHYLGVVELAGPIEFTGDVSGAAASMSPHVKMLEELLLFEDLRGHFEKWGLSQARSFSCRTLALIYCDLGTVLSFFGLAPFKYGYESLTQQELTISLSSRAARSVVLMLKKLTPVDWQSRISETGVESTERRLVDELFPIAPCPRPHWWHDHACKDALSMLPFSKSEMRMLGFGGRVGG